MHSTLAAAMVPMVLVCHCILCPPLPWKCQADGERHSTPYKRDGLQKSLVQLSARCSVVPVASTSDEKEMACKSAKPAVCQVSQMSRQHQLGILAGNSIAGSDSPDCTLGNSESYSNSFSRPLLPLHVDEVLQSWMTIITSILEALDFLCVVTLECSCCNMQRTDLAGPKVAEADPVSHQPPETIAGTNVEFSQTSFGCHFKQTRLPLR